LLSVLAYGYILTSIPAIQQALPPSYDSFSSQADVFIVFLSALNNAAQWMLMFTTST
jgi:hypothetical protein